VNTLKAVLGNEPGTKAKAFYTSIWGQSIWNIIEQYKDKYGDLYWKHYDEGDDENAKCQTWNFDTIAFYYDVNEPIWMTA
jgi:hypothetical protein